MLRLLSVILTLFCIAGVANAQQAKPQSPPQVMMILDGSNSMWGQIEGTAKIAIAKDVMTDLITNWDDQVPLGLMIYGHRRKSDCQDIELVSMPGQADRKVLLDKVQAIKPRGKTPISLSLTTARAQFLLQNLGKYPKPKSSLVLVSDGLETCNADPCASASALEISDPGVDVHVIGFDVTDEESRALQCISRNTGGKFFRANNASELQAALKETVKIASGEAPAPAPVAEPDKPSEPQASQFLYAKLCETCERINPLEVSWSVYRNGQPFYDGLGVIFPDDPVFEAGTYEVAARYKSTHVTGKGEIVFGEDGKQIGELNLNGGSAVLFAYASDDKTIAADPIFYAFFPIRDGKAADKSLDQAASSNATTWLPAGRYKVVASHDQIKESAEIEIVAGQETRYEFDMRVGYLRPSAVLTPGGQPLGGDMDYAVFQTEESALDRYASGLFFLGASNKDQPLKPGKYFVRSILSYKRGATSLRRVFPVEIKANEIAQPVFDMNAGILTHKIRSKSGKGISYVRYMRAEDGKEQNGGIAGSHALALQPGTYFMKISTSGYPSETFESDPFEILAGKNTTINVTIP